jgi:hypothetical protein
MLLGKLSMLLTEVVPKAINWAASLADILPASAMDMIYFLTLADMIAPHCASPTVPPKVLHYMERRVRRYYANKELEFDTRIAKVRSVSPLCLLAKKTWLEEATSQMKGLSQPLT